jgi:hypothetical protein
MKTDPAPPGLTAAETAVTLDDGTIVAVSIQNVPQANGAPSVLQAIARAINADGTPVNDSEGEAVTSPFSFTPSADTANDPTAFAAAQKDCLLIVLGEPPVTILQDAIHSASLDNASIRNRLSALAIAGPVDAGALL